MGPRIFLKHQTVRGCRGIVSFCKDSGSYCELDKNGKTLTMISIHLIWVRIFRISKQSEVMMAARFENATADLKILCLTYFIVLDSVFV